MICLLRTYWAVRIHRKATERCEHASDGKTCLQDN